MPKPWAADDRPKEWVCPDCRERIPKPGHKPDCSMPLENPTRQEIDDSVFKTWNKNATYAMRNYSRNIGRIVELLEVSRDTAALIFFLDMTSLNTQNDLKHLRGLVESIFSSDLAGKFADIVEGWHREIKERKKADDWKQEEDGEGG